MNSDERLLKRLRILLDESIPIELAELIPRDCSTVREQRWLRLKNGALLRSAVNAGFDVLVTRDANLRYQQNLRAIGISVIVLTRVFSDVAHLQLLIPQILVALDVIRRGEVIEISPQTGDTVRDVLTLDLPRTPVSTV